MHVRLVRRPAPPPALHGYGYGYYIYTGYGYEYEGPRAGPGGVVQAERRARTSRGGVMADAKATCVDASENKKVPAREQDW